MVMPLAPACVFVSICLCVFVNGYVMFINGLKVFSLRVCVCVCL